MTAHRGDPTPAPAGEISRADASGAHQGSRFEVRDHAQQYGTPLGVVMLEFASPFVPGDIGNASTFGYPVLYQSVPGLSVQAILNDTEGRFAGQVVEAARSLVRSGVGAVTSNCGFMLRYQADVARAVAPATVVMSSLLQLPLIASTIAPDRSIGIITADSRALTEEFVSSALGPISRRLTIAGLETAPSFAFTMLEGGATLDAGAIGDEVEQATAKLLADDPEVAAIVLECAALPPYAQRAQRASNGLPVYDFTTMTDWLHHARYRKAFHGYY